MARCPLPFSKRIAEHEQRKSAVPDHVEPDGGLRARTEQPAGRKQAGKGQGVDDGRHAAVNKYPLASSSSAREREIANCENNRTAVIRSLIASAD